MEKKTEHEMEMGSYGACRACTTAWLSTSNPLLLRFDILTGS